MELFWTFDIYIILGSPLRGIKLWNFYHSFTTPRHQLEFYKVLKYNCSKTLPLLCPSWMNSYKFLELYETAQAVVFILALKKIAGEVERILIGFIDTRGMMITTVWHVPCEVNFQNRIIKSNVIWCISLPLLWYSYHNILRMILKEGFKIKYKK